MPQQPDHPSRQRLVIHLDMDSFYVSVERLIDPSLIGKPVAVGGSADGRGVISSASYEARKFGVRSAMPSGQALRLCPDLIIVGRGYSQYGEYSRQVESVLTEFTPHVQMASQDEAYLDLTGSERLWGPPLVVADKIRRRVTEETKLPCSLGVATNKLVAKVASALGKPKGLLYIPAGSEESFFAPLNVGRLPGVGKKTLEKLKELGVQYMRDLAAMDPKRLERHFGKYGLEMANRARGISESEVVIGEAAKSISSEETFSRDLLDGAAMEGILANLCERVAYRVRKSECKAFTLTLKFRYSNFETHTASTTLSNATDDELEILSVIRGLFWDRWAKNRSVRLLGVAAGNLQYGREQLDFLNAEDDEKKKRLHEAVDSLREKHGFAKVRRAGSVGRAEEQNEKRWG